MADTDIAERARLALAAAGVSASSEDLERLVPILAAQQRRPAPGLATEPALVNAVGRWGRP